MASVCASLAPGASPALHRLQQRSQHAPHVRRKRPAAASASGRVAVPPPPPPPPPLGSGSGPQSSVSSTSLLTMGVVMGFQAST